MLQSHIPDNASRQLPTAIFEQIVVCGNPLRNRNDQGTTVFMLLMYSLGGWQDCLRAERLSATWVARAVSDLARKRYGPARRQRHLSSVLKTVCSALNDRRTIVVIKKDFVTMVWHLVRMSGHFGRQSGKLRLSTLVR